MFRSFVEYFLGNVNVAKVTDVTCGYDVSGIAKDGCAGVADAPVHSRYV